MGPTQVATGVHRIDTTVTGTEMPLAFYLVEGATWLVTDTGCVGMMRDLAIPAARYLRPGATIGRAVVCHAHADHFGGNAELLEANPSCTIHVHREDAAWAREPRWHVRDAYGGLGADDPCPPEVTSWVANLLGPPTPVSALTAGDRIGLDDGRALQVIHLPGHSRGHIGLWEPEERLLVLSDAILGDGQRIAGKVVGIPSYLDVDAYLASIRAVRTLEPDICCPAHFEVMDRARTRAFCDASEAFVGRLDHEIWQVLQRGAPRTLRQLTEEVVPIVAPGADTGMVAALSVQAHLDSYERRGMTTWHMEGDRRAWTTA